jgi:Domain of unknown function (DUF5914)
MRIWTGAGSVVETPATPLGVGPKGRPLTMMTEARIAYSDRPGFSAARWMAPLIRAALGVPPGGSGSMILPTPSNGTNSGSAANSLVEPLSQRVRLWIRRAGAASRWRDRMGTVQSTAGNVIEQIPLGFIAACLLARTGRSTTVIPTGSPALATRRRTLRPWTSVLMGSGAGQHPEDPAPNPARWRRFALILAGWSLIMLTSSSELDAADPP